MGRLQMKITTEWLKEKNACPEGINWFIAQKETDGIKVVKELMSQDNFDWANWLIVRLMEKKQNVAYAVFVAEQVAYLWKDKYPEKYKIWREWFDSGCPQGKAAYVATRTARTVYAAYVAHAIHNAYVAHAVYAAANAAHAVDATHAADAATHAVYAATHAAAYAAEKRRIKTVIINYGLRLLGEHEGAEKRAKEQGRF